jgi:proline iminopeptidase
MEYEISGEGIPLLMVMGVGGQLVQWPPDFCAALIEQGFMLIRPDNRDVGLSEKLTHLGVPNTQRAFVRQALKMKPLAPYTLEDMAEDMIQLMDHLQLERCHVVGISMGSMISQILASKYPSRV